MPPPEQSLTLPAKYLIKRQPIFIDEAATVAQAASVMQNSHIGSVLVAANPPGIITDRDLRGRILAAGLSSETPARKVMSRPLKTLDSDVPVFTALHFMLEEHIHHLALVEEGKIVGVISSTDLLRHEATSAFYLRRTLDSVEDPKALAHYSREVGDTVQTLFRGGLGAAQIGQIVSSLNDALADAKPRLVCFVVYGQNPNSGTTNMIGNTACAALLKATYTKLKSTHPDVTVVGGANLGQVGVAGQPGDVRAGAHPRIFVPLP